MFLLTNFKNPKLPVKWKKTEKHYNDAKEWAIINYYLLGGKLKQKPRKTGGYF